MGFLDLLLRLATMVARYALLGRVSAVVDELKDDRKYRLVTNDDLHYPTSELRRAMTRSSPPLDTGHDSCVKSADS
jgi:hypothetical protein